MRIFNTACRCTGLAAIAVLLMLATASDAAAQLGGCRCAAVGVVNNTTCDLTLILQGSNETFIVVGAGKKGEFGCEAGMNVLVQDCRGRLHPLTVGACVFVVLGEGCCVNVCLEEYARGCYRVVAHLPAVDCPCT